MKQYEISIKFPEDKSLSQSIELDELLSDQRVFSYTKILEVNESGCYFENYILNVFI